MWWRIVVSMVGALIAMGVYLWWPTLSPEFKVRLRYTIAWMIFWAFLGAMFGIISASTFLYIAEVPRAQVTVWLVVGTTGTTIWGAIWGGVYAVTELHKRQQEAGREADSTPPTR